MINKSTESIDPAALQMIERAKGESLSTCFSRVDEIEPCPIGIGGGCCKVCFMGPCRLAIRQEGERTGVCGATLDTIAARNLARAIAGGCAAHADHGRDLAFALLAIAEGKAPGLRIKDFKKLRTVAKHMDVEVNDASEREIALRVANTALANFGQQRGELAYISRAPQRRQELWRKLGIVPRGIDREAIELMHRTNMGTDQDPEHILLQALRASLADGWGGSMLATDLSDMLFGTPNPLNAKVNLGVLKEDEVNIVVHGHEPILSEMIVRAVKDKDLLKFTKSKGARGINLVGICCTSNEILMRHGIPPAGNFLHQELAIITGAVDVMVVDVQCVVQALAGLAKHFHTKLITTSPKAKIPGAVHIEFDEQRGLDIAREIVRMAINNFPKRKEVQIPHVSRDLVAGFSHEYVRYMLGGTYRASLRPLNEAIIVERIKGIVGVVGCNNPRVTQDHGHNYVVRELIRHNVLVVQTGCGALANAKCGLLAPDAMESAGPFLKQICKVVGIPPVLHLGSCVDNSRILTIFADMVAEGGLGEDISDLPVAAVVPEWVCEKALAIGSYFAASGCHVIFGVGSPVSASEKVTNLITHNWEEKLGGKLEFEPRYSKIVEKVLARIERKRKSLGISPGTERGLPETEKRRVLIEWQKRLKSLFRPQ